MSNKVLDFSEKTKIDGDRVTNQRYFLYLCLGLIKHNLRKVKGNYKNKFDVYYYDGGCGGDGVEIRPIKNQDASIIFGLCGSRFGCSACVSSENGIMGSFDMGINKNVYTFSELNDFIIAVLIELFENKKIRQITDNKIRQKHFAQYHLKYKPAKI